MECEGKIICTMTPFLNNLSPKNLKVLYGNLLYKHLSLESFTICINAGIDCGISAFLGTLLGKEQEQTNYSYNSEYTRCYISALKQSE
jgi:hypothetical protein